jgi:hypothetical protein
LCKLSDITISKGIPNHFIISGISSNVQFLVIQHTIRVSVHGNKFIIHDSIPSICKGHCPMALLRLLIRKSFCKKTALETLILPVQKKRFHLIFSPFIFGYKLSNGYNHIITKPFKRSSIRKSVVLEIEEPFSGISKEVMGNCDNLKVHMKHLILWEPPMRASHRLPKAVSKQQLDKQDCRGDQLSRSRCERFLGSPQRSTYTVLPKTSRRSKGTNVKDKPVTKITRSS